MVIAYSVSYHNLLLIGQGSPVGTGLECRQLSVFEAGGQLGQQPAVAVTVLAEMFPSGGVVVESLFERKTTCNRAYTYIHTYIHTCIIYL